MTDNQKHEIFKDTIHKILDGNDMVAAMNKMVEKGEWRDFIEQLIKSDVLGHYSYKEEFLLTADDITWLMHEFTIAELRATVAERDKEIREIDEALARRPALDDCNTRYDKVYKACTVAGRANKAEAELAALREKMKVIEEDYKKITETKQKLCNLCKHRNFNSLYCAPCNVDCGKYATRWELDKTITETTEK